MRAITERNPSTNFYYTILLLWVVKQAEKSQASARLHCGNFTIICNIRTIAEEVGS